MRQFGINRSNDHGCTLVWLFVLLLCGSWACKAQTTAAQLSGLITDPSGALIPGASITATNVATGTSRKGLSNDSGNYTLSLLPPGTYRVLVEKEGFSPLTENHLVLSINQHATLNVPLTAGSVSESITVQGSTELLRASSAELGTVINEKTVHELPLNGRNFTQLLTLTPGATPVSTSQGANVGTDDGSTVTLPGSSTSNPSINGQQNRSTLYLYDGVVNTDFRTTTYTVLPIIDAIDEFKVVSHSDDPQYGSVLGGIVNLISKSGTNNLHGSAWEYVRNNIFDARNSFSDIGAKGPTAAAPFRQNEFGGTFGGPVRIPRVYDGRDKMFFFAAYEGWRYRQPPNVQYYSPTDAELNGDFSHSVSLNKAGQPTPIYDPNTTTQTVPGTYTRTQFAYGGTPNVIDPARINAQVQTYLKTYLDRPNASGLTGANTVVTHAQSNDANDYHGRFDYSLTGKDNIFLRYSTMGVKVGNPVSNNISSQTTFSGVNYGGGYTHVFTPRVIFDVRGGRATRPFTFVNASSAGTAGLAGFSTLANFGPPGFGFDQVYAGVGLNGAALRRNSSGSLSSSLNWQLGNHSVTFGGGFIQQYRSQSGNSQGYTFDVTQTGNPAAASTTSIQDQTGNALASALLGLPTTGQFNTGNVIHYSFVSWSAAISDSWKATPKLTVNFGMRYDRLNQPNLTSGVNNGFDFSSGNYFLGGGHLPPACIVSNASPCIPGSSTNAATDLAAVVGNDGSIAGSHIIVDPDPNRAPKPVNTNFGPRFGFGYKITPNWVTRGGFGIMFDDLSGISQTFSNSINTWPNAGNANPHFNATFGAPLTTVAQSQGNIVGGLPSATPFNQGGFLYDPNMKIPYSEQYNLGVETTVKGTYLISLTYVGAVSNHLDYGGTANAAKIPGNKASIPFPYMTTFSWDQSTANSNYNSLHVKVVRRMTNGLQFLLSYSYAKSIDDASGRFGLAENGPGGSSANQNFYDPASNRAVSAYDIPHFLSIAGIYELPVGKGKQYLKTGVPAFLLGGWEINSLAQLRSGQPYTLQVDGDVANIFNTSTYARPNIVPGISPKLSNPTKAQWFNPAAFSVPVGTFGNVSRNSMRSSSVNNFDLSLLKNFTYKEGVYLQFRAEAFNVFNIINYGVPASDISQTTSVGKVSSQALPSRQLQLALKLNF